MSRARFSLLACTLFLSVLLAPLRGETPAPAVEQLAWMAGSWEATRGKASIEEHWTQPAGGTLFGVNRTLVAGKTKAFEFLRIETREEGIFYVAQPGGRPPTDFKLTKLEKQEVVFENPEHDFPQRIIYRKESDGTLHARVEGKQNGKEAGTDFFFTPRRKEFQPPK